MLIRGLPSALLSREANVRLANNCPVLQMCRFCGAFSLEYFVCALRHAICSQCAPNTLGPQTTNFLIAASSSDSSSSPSSRAMCPLCSEHMAHLLPVKVSLALIEQLDFECVCGFVGVLADIRVHLNRCNLHATRPKLSFGPSALPSVDRALAITVPARTRRTAATASREAAVSRSSVSWLSEFELRKCIQQNMDNELKHVSNMLEEVMLMNRRLATDVEEMKVKTFGERKLLHFDFHCLRALQTTEVEWTSENATLRVGLRLSPARDDDTDDDEPSWIRLVVESVPREDERHSLSLKKKTISLRMIDSRGDTVTRARIESFVDGKFVDAANNNNNISSNNNNNNNISSVSRCSFPKFVSSAKIVEPGVIVDGQILISAEIRSRVDSADKCR